MTKKKLLERIEKIEEVVGAQGSFVGFDCDLGWRIDKIYQYLDTLRETQNLLLKYLKLQIKETPEQPAKKEIVPEPSISIFNSGLITSCYIAADELSTPPQSSKSKKPKKSTLRK